MSGGDRARAGATLAAATPLDLALATCLSILGVLVTAWVTSQVGDGRLPLAGDAHYVWLSARSLAFDGDLDLTNQYAQFGDKWGLGRWPATDGTRFPPRELGPSLLMLPGLFLLHWLQAWCSAGQCTSTWPWAPGSEAWLATLPSAASLGPLFLALRRIVAHAITSTTSERSTVAASRETSQRLVTTLTLAATLGFVPPFYAVGHAGYAHAPDAVVCAWLVVAFIERRSTFATGGLLALAVTMRLQNVLWLVWPIVDTWRSAAAATRSNTKTEVLRDGVARPATLMLMACLGITPQVLLAVLHPGSEVGSIRWGPGFFDVEGLGGDLVTVLVGVHGLWSWTPIAAIATVGLAFACRRPSAANDPLADAARPSLLVASALVVLVALVPDPDGGDAFGARRLAGLTSVFALGLAAIVGALRPRDGSETRPRRFVLPAFVVLVSCLAAANVVRVALALTGVLVLRP